MRIPAGELTYPEVGATRDAELPPGYGHVDRELVIAHGRAAFVRAARELMTWGMHRGAGLRVESSEPVAAPGVTVVLRLPLVPAAIPCRVVHTVRSENTAGFAYGTLPGHPERGEEAFVLTLTGNGDVVLNIRAFSRPATFLARAGGPVTRIVQRRVTTRYLEALRRLANP